MAKTTNKQMRKQKGIPSATELGVRATNAKSFDVAKALQLRLVKHLSYAQIGALYKTSPANIRKGLKPMIALLNDPQAVQAFRSSEAELMDAVRMLAMQAMGEQLTDPKRRKKLDLLRLNNLYGTLFDKQRLVRGESTQIIHQLTAIISAAHKEVRPLGKDIEVRSEPASSEGDEDATQPSG